MPRRDKSPFLPLPSLPCHPPRRRSAVAGSQAKARKAKAIKSRCARTDSPRRAAAARTDSPRCALARACGQLAPSTTAHWRVFAAAGGRSASERARARAHGGHTAMLAPHRWPPEAGSTTAAAQLVLYRFSTSTLFSSRSQARLRPQPSGCKDVNEPKILESAHGWGRGRGGCHGCSGRPGKCPQHQHRLDHACRRLSLCCGAPNFACAAELALTALWFLSGDEPLSCWCRCG
jgi:hypothetical protein